MSYNRRKVMAVEKQGTVVFNDGSTLSFVYYPNKNTPNFSEELTTLQEKGEIKNHTVEWIARLLKTWDVVDEVPQTDADGSPIIGPDGNQVTIEIPVEVSTETVGSLPNVILGELVTAIFNDMKSDPTNGTQSRGSFV